MLKFTNIGFTDRVSEFYHCVLPLQFIMTMVDDEFELEFIPVAAAALPSPFTKPTIPQFFLNTVYERCTSKKGDPKDKVSLQP